MSRVTLPEPIDLVSAEDVRVTIARIDKDLSELERRADYARARADVQENRAAELGVDGRASTWAMVRLQRFIDGLRSETEGDVGEIIDVARARAAARIAEAEAEAIAIMRPATRVADLHVDPVASNGTAPAAPTPPAALLDVEDPALVSMSAIVFDEAVDEVEPVPPVTVPEPAPVVETLVETPAVEAPLVEPPVADAAPIEVMATPAAEVADPLAEAESAPVDAREFWPPAEPPKKSFVRRIPVSAILEILAVLLILTFILLRLS